MSVKVKKYNSTNDNIKQEYIKALIANLDGVKSQHLLYITFQLGTIALTLNNVIFNNGYSTYTSEQKNSLITALIALALSSAIGMLYITMVHNKKLQAVDWLITLDVDEARTVHYPQNKFYKKWGWIQMASFTFMFLGIVKYFEFAIRLLNK